MPASSRRVLDVAIATDAGLVRRTNEDCAAAVSVAASDGRPFALWLVADGVGGGPLGEQASRLAVDTAVEYLTATPWNDAPRALADAFGAASRRVHALGNGAAATTLIAALVNRADDCFFVANVGDSRAYLIAAGEARAITTDHSVAAARLAAGQITAEQARMGADRNFLTRSIGEEPGVAVDVYGPRWLLPEERLVLCSDGIYGMIDDAAIAHLAGCGSADEAARALVDAAVRAGGRDNATALVGGLPGSGPGSIRNGRFAPRAGVRAATEPAG